MNNLKQKIEDSRESLAHTNHRCSFGGCDIEKEKENIKSHEEIILKAVLERLEKSIPVEENGSERKITIPKYLMDFIKELNKLINKG